MIDEPTPLPDLLWHRPEPGSLWIEAAPRIASREASAWLDPRTRDLVAIGRRPAAARSRPVHGPAVIYLPPAELLPEGMEDELLGWCSAESVALLRHASPSSFAAAGSTPLLDCLVSVIRRDWEGLSEAAPGSIAEWPLLSGIGDSEEAMTVGLEAVAVSGPLAVVAVVPELSPRSRRSLSEAFGETVFDALFHPAEVEPRRFAAAARGLGLEFLPPRLAGPGSRQLERHVAAELAVVADLLLALEASPSRAQGFYRAARWVESTHHDLAGLAREGNLGVVPFLDAEMEDLIVELAGGAERSSLLAGLADRYAVRT